MYTSLHKFTACLINQIQQRCFVSMTNSSNFWFTVVTLTYQSSYYTFHRKPMRTWGTVYGVNPHNAEPLKMYLYTLYVSNISNNITGKFKFWYDLDNFLKVKNMAYTHDSSHLVICHFSLIYIVLFYNPRLFTNEKDGWWVRSTIILRPGHFLNMGSGLSQSKGTGSMQVLHSYVK